MTDRNMMLTVDEYMALRRLIDGERESEGSDLSQATPNPPKKRRKVGKYQREFGRQLRLLKAKHPRTPTSRLMKRAHSITRRMMK